MARPFRRSALILGLLLLLHPSSGRADEVLDSLMYHLPELPMPPVVTLFPEEAKGLWLKALQRPEADLRCKAADAIALAHRRGFKGMDTTVGPLIVVLDRPEQDASVRLAVARTLVTLEARDTAPNLFRQAQSGDGDLCDVIEPALARWDYQPEREVWLDRLRDPETPPRGLILAIRGLGVVREARAADRLRELALSERESRPLRLESARTLAMIRSDGLEKDAETLGKDATPRGLVSRLVAVSLLRQHRSDEAVRLLQRFAIDPEPAVAAVAVARLLEIDPELLVPAVERLLASPDANIRTFAVDVLLRRPSDQYIRWLGDRLDDAHPDVRARARRAMQELAAKKEYRDQVIAAATQTLEARRWAGLEQAAILLADLGHKPAAARLVELLAFDRPEVVIAAAWGLRKLAVPETLPAVLDYVKTEHGLLMASKKRPGQEEVGFDVIDHQLSHLNQFLGQQKYAAADELLRKFVPKPMNKPIGNESRAAAVWALGLIHEGTTVAPLARALEERLNDVAAIPPEDNRVRRMSALSLGRMKAKDALESLRRWCPNMEPALDPVNNACGWAVEQITGEAMAPPKPVEVMQRDWFLVPSR